MKLKDKKLFIAGIGFIIGLVFVVYGIVSLKTDNNREISKNKDDKKVSLFLNLNEDDEKKVNVNGKELTITIKNREVSLKNGDKKVLTKKLNALNSSLQLYNEQIAIKYEYSENSFVEVYDIDGNLLVTIDDKLIENANWVNLGLINDDKIEVKVENNYGAGPRITEKIQLCGCGQCGTSMEDYKELIDENRDKFVEATYEIDLKEKNTKPTVKEISIEKTVDDYLKEVIDTDGEWCVSVKD